MKLYNGGKSIKHIRGDSGTITITAIKKNGEAISDYTAIFSLKKNITDTAYALQKTASNGDFTFEPADTTALSEGMYAFDIQVTLSDGTVYTPIVGNFMLEPDVTRNGGCA